MPGWRQRLRLQGWRLWALVALVAYTLLGFLALPWIARDQASNLAREQLGVELAIDKLRFNPFLFRLEVEGLSLDDPESGPVLDFRRLVVDFSLSSAWRRAWTFGELTLEQPRLRLHRGADGIDNFQRMLARLPASGEPAAPAAASNLPRLVVHDAALVALHIAIEDEAHPDDWSLALGPLSFAMQDFSTLPEREGVYRLEGSGPGGGTLRWRGSFAVGPLASSGRIEMDRLALAPFWEYVEHDFDAALAGDARVDLAFEYALNVDDAGVNLRLRQGRAALAGLEVVQRSSGAALLALPRAAADDIDFDLAQATLGIGSVEVTQPSVELRRLEDGRIDLVAALAPAAADAGTDEVTDEATDEEAVTPAEHGAADAGPSQAGLAVVLGELRIDGGRVAFEDRAAPGPVRVVLEEIGIAVSDYRSADGHRADVNLDATLASGGTLSLAGALRGVPLDAGFDVRLADLSLLPALPYADHAINLDVQSLLADAQGRIVLNAEEPFAYTGDAALRALASRLPDEDEQLVGWQVLDAEGIDLSLAGRALRIEKIALTEPFLRVLVNEDGELNLTRTVRSDQAMDGADTAPVGKERDRSATADAFSVGVGRVEIHAGAMDFTDLNLPIPFAALVKPLQGSVSAITSGSPTPARIEIDGDVNEYGAATIRGSLDLFDPKRVMDLELDFRNIEMPDLTPYTVKFAGREIADGRLDVDLSWSIRDGRLEANNRMVIRNLELGERVESPGALSLPLDLAVALLTDSQGRIDLAVPVTGDLNDPQFRYAPLVFKALGNVLGRIVTAPFRFLAALLGGGAEEADLEFVGFVAGDATLRGPEAEDLAKLAKALAQRPELALQVGAAFDAARDGGAMRERRLDDAISARFEAGAASGREGDPVRLVMEAMYAEASGPEASAALQAAHLETPADSDEPVLDETRYLEALRAALLQQQVIEPQEFRMLGMERSAAVRNYLVESGGLDPARVSLAEPGDAPRADDNLVFLKLELGVGD